MRLLLLSTLLSQVSGWNLFPLSIRPKKFCDSIRSIGSKNPAFRSLRPLKMGSGVENVDAESFEFALQETSGPLVVDFYATWCGPCVFLAPQLEEVAKHYKGKVRFLKVDTDENEALASSFKIFGLPTLIFIKEGKMLKRIEGALMADKLISLCDYLFFDGSLPTDSDVKNLLNEDDLMV